MLSLLSFAMPAIAQPISSEASTTPQSLQTTSAQPTLEPEVEWKQLIDAIFTPKAVKLTFSTFSAIGEKENPRYSMQSGNIYYSNGELFVLYDESSQGEPNTNFATINGKLYAWENGAKEGEILKRIDKDTEALLIYMVDPAGFKRSVYFQSYREKPSDFNVTQQGDTKTILFKQVKWSFAGVKIQEHPFWLRSFVFCNCQSVKPFTPVSILEVSRPIPIEQVPESVKVLPPDVKFEPSEATVEYYLKYL